ncbi:hypothetical protein PAAL109150_07515 [Paenibacillus alkaliterrae]
MKTWSMSESISPIVKQIPPSGIRKFLAWQRGIRTLYRWASGSRTLSLPSMSELLAYAPWSLEERPIPRMPVFSSCGK